MITKLKRRFIALAMASLIVLLTAIVTGMNLINYNTVISEADEKLAALSVNGGTLPFFEDDSFGYDNRLDWPWQYEDDEDYDDYDDIDAATREACLDSGAESLSVRETKLKRHGFSPF